MLRRHLFLADNSVAIKGFAINGFAKNSLLHQLGAVKLLSHHVIRGNGWALTRQGSLLMMRLPLPVCDMHSQLVRNTLRLFPSPEVPKLYEFLTH